MQLSVPLLAWVVKLGRTWQMGTLSDAFSARLPVEELQELWEVQEERLRQLLRTLHEKPPSRSQRRRLRKPKDFKGKRQLKVSKLTLLRL